MASACTNQFAARSTYGGHATKTFNWDTATIKARIGATTWFSGTSTPTKNETDIGDGVTGSYPRMTGSSEVTCEDTFTVYLDEANNKLQFKYTPVATLEFASITTGTPKWVCFYYVDTGTNVPLAFVDLGTQSAITTTTTVQVSWSGVSNVVHEIAQ